MSKTVIISGGTIDEGFVEKVLAENPEAYIIGVDKGLEYLYNHQIEPQYIVGDFDSIDSKVIDYYRNETNIPIREYNPVKDATDTEIALRLGITLGSKEMILLGATGAESITCGQISRLSPLRAMPVYVRIFWIREIKYG